MASIFEHFFKDIAKITNPSFSLSVEAENKPSLDTIAKDLVIGKLNFKDDQIEIKVKIDNNANLYKVVSDMVFALSISIARLFRLALNDIKKAKIKIDTTGYEQKFEIELPSTEFLRNLIKDKMIFKLMRSKHALGSYKMFDPDVNKSFIDLLSYDIYKLHTFDSILAKESEQVKEEEEKSDKERRVNLNINNLYDKTSLLMLFVYATLYSKTKNKVFGLQLYNKLDQTKVIDYIGSEYEKDLIAISRAIVSKHILSTTELVSNISRVIESLDKQKIAKLKSLSPTKDDMIEIGDWFATGILVDLLMM
jgi:hypothetical protein